MSEASDDRAIEAESDVLAALSIDATFDRSPIAGAIATPDGRLIRVNAAMTALTGYSKSELLAGMRLEDLTHPDDVLDLVAIEATTPPRTVRQRFLRLDGSLVPAQTSVIPIDDDAGHLIAVLEQASGPTQLTEFIDASRVAADWYERLLAGAADVILVLDDQGVTRYASPNIDAVLDYALEDFVGERLEEFIHPDDLWVVRSTIEHSIGSTGPTVVRFRTCNANGEWRWMDARLMDLVDEPLVGGIVCNLRDVTDRVLVEDALRHQALHDALTGLPNRSLLRDRIETAASRADRANTTFAVLFCDLDHFKHVNDTLGHQVGDALLVAVADRLRAEIRSADTLARVGGDEFVLLAEGIDPDRAEQAAKQMADQILAALAEPISVQGHDVTMGTSVGIAIHDREQTVDDMLRDADVAMYAAKAAGRGRTMVHDTTMRAEAERRFMMDGIVRRALDEGGVDVEFQPVIDLTTQRVIGAEALVRLIVDGNYYEPSMFLHAAEESGSIVELGEEVLLTALEEVATWPSSAFVTVNMSARQLASEHMADAVIGALEASGTAPSQLVIEVTETSLVEASSVMDRVMWRLKEAGVRIALDDFGTGWSSLSYLRRFPVSILKIDQSFVQGVDQIGSRDIEVIRAVVGLAQALGIAVIAEGVESEAQSAIITELGCDMGQGYLYGRPTHRLFASDPLTQVG